MNTDEEPKGQTAFTTWWKIEEYIEELRNRLANRLALVDATLARALDFVTQNALAKTWINQETLDALDGWLANANRVGLHAWLTTKGGWDKVDLQTLTDELRPFILEASDAVKHNADDPRGLIAMTLEGSFVECPNAIKDSEGSWVITYPINPNNWNGLPVNDADGTPARWLKILANDWLEDAAEAEAERIKGRAKDAERESQARGLDHIKRVELLGHTYAQLPAYTAPISWAFGSAGVDLPEGYAISPRLGALVPAGYSIIPAKELKKGHQAVLPLAVEGDDTPPLVLAMVGTSNQVLSLVASKIALMTLEGCWNKPESLLKTTLRELTQAAYPETKRLRPEKHFIYVAQALNEARDLRVLWPNGYADAIFYVPRTTWKTPEKEDLDEPIFLGLDRNFIENTLPQLSKISGLSGLGGQFVYNRTAAMKMDTAGPFRQYLRAMATANAFWDFKTKKKAPDLIPKMATLQWAAINGYLPPSTGLSGTANRRKKSEAIKAVLEDAKYLSEEAKVLKLTEADKNFIRYEPTDDTLEAWEHFRAGKVVK